MAALLQRAQTAWLSATAVLSDDTIAFALPEVVAKHADLVETWQSLSVGMHELGGNLIRSR